MKLKADYLEGFTDTLDLLILGGYYTEGWQGKSKKVEGVKSFLVGAYDKENNRWMGVCKVSSGFSEKDL